MTKTSKKTIAFISSYLPRKCGIATFANDLVTNISRCAEENFKPLVVAMSNENLKYNEPVKFEIQQNVKRDYISAADFVNFSHVDLVSVQHEFGLFGGDAGSYLMLLLKRLNAPIITTLHTVLNDPPDAYKKSMTDLCNVSEKVITMNERGVWMLDKIYGIHGRKIKLIPHGIPDLPFVDNNYYKHKFGMEGRKTILTFGLLSKNKGIEVMLDAMPDIVKADPSVLYVILGMTHPAVIKHDGESYRFSLQRKVKELGISKNVVFHDRFVTDQELSNFLCAADIYVTPYLNEEQLTSGTLSFAVGTGKAVISTPYWAAKELLEDGRGIIVNFNDSKQIANSVIKIIKDDSLFYSLRRRAYDYGRSRTWPKIGEKYWKLFNERKLSVLMKVEHPIKTSDTNDTFQVPEPSLDHLLRLTDDTGIFQHAKFTVPDRQHGYCTDDNARAVIAMTRYYAQYPNPQALKLLNGYLAFVVHSQTSDGLVRNFMSFDRSWWKKEPLHDAIGRLLWALGALMANPPASAYLPIIKDRFDLSVRHIRDLHPRAMAYSIFGMNDYLKQFPGASEIKRRLAYCADHLLDLYKKNSSEQWQWFEETMTYDNAILPAALFVAGRIFGEKYLDAAQKTCRFLIENTTEQGRFSFVGCKGWYKRGQTKAQFDQQPIEAASTVIMLRAAYEATEDPKFLVLQRKAFDWFLGDNDLQISLYDFRTKGCYDGLEPAGVNSNQGAESILSFMLSLLSIIESYPLFDKINETKKNLIESIDSTPESNIPIKETLPLNKKQNKKNLINTKDL